MWIILLAIWFAGWVYFAYGKMEGIVLSQVNQAVDQTMTIVSQQLESGLTTSSTGLTGTSGALDVQVDAFIMQQKQNVQAKIAAETDRIKLQISENIKEYLTNKVNVLFGIGGSTQVTEMTE